MDPLLRVAKHVIFSGECLRATETAKSQRVYLVMKVMACGSLELPVHDGRGIAGRATSEGLLVVR